MICMVRTIPTRVDGVPIGTAAWQALVLGHTGALAVAGTRTAAWESLCLALRHAMDRPSLLCESAN